MANVTNSKNYANTQLARFNPQFVQTAEVMDNRDPTRNGKLKVWISNSQSNKESKDSWITCRYCSVFAGRTPGQAGADTYSQYPKSYGFWAVPPDVGATVSVFFANGNIHDAYWFGCVYDERMNSMVPGSATQILDNSGYDMPVPITDYDRNSVQSMMEQKYFNIPLVEGLKKQNLLYDDQRGIPNRSSTRSVINNVYGMNSPRGQSFILDDGFLEGDDTAPTWDSDKDGYQDSQLNNPVNDTRVGSRKNEGIVLRTRSGAQFLLSESNGNVFIINRDGTARIEMTADGQIIGVSDKSITFRTAEDFNFIAGRNINFDAAGELNMKIAGNTKLSLTGKVDVSAGSTINVNAASDLRLYSAASVRVQSGSDLNMSSGSTAALTAASSVNIKGTSVNVSGSGSNLTVADTVVSDAELSASDFKTPSVGLNTHVHEHEMWQDAQNHSNRMAPPSGGGRSGKPTPAIDAQPANDIAPEAPVATEQDAVANVNSTVPVSQSLEQDMLYDNSTVSYTQSLEGLKMVMPVTGQIRQYGYWGRGVDDGEGGTANRNGWIIQAKGNVYAPADGTVTLLSSGGVIITHRNGYKSIFYEINVTANNLSAVSKGDVIGQATGVMVFEIRMITAAIYGFGGTIDPGKFYQTVTGTGAECANKSLKGNEVSNPNATANVISTSVDSDELVQINTVQTIGSAYGQRGSRHVPRRKAVRGRSTNNGGGTAFKDDLSNIDKQAVGWKVQPSDKKLLEDLKHFEGSIEYQSAKGFFRGGKFWTYQDSLGFATIGYGHKVTTQESISGAFGAGITEEQSEQILMKDVVSSVNSAKRLYATYKMHTPYMVQLVLVEMIFQMGAGGVAKFRNMLTNMANGNYSAAANEIRSSLWYRQTTNRAEILARRLEACQ